MIRDEIRAGVVVWIRERLTISGRDYFYLFPATVTGIHDGRIAGQDSRGVPVETDFRHLFPSKDEALASMPADMLIDLSSAGTPLNTVLAPLPFKGGVGVAAQVDLKRLIGDRLVADDRLVHEELLRRSLWERFLASRDAVNRRPRSWAVITESDIFVGFEGFETPADNGYVWYFDLDPNQKKAVIENFVQNITPEETPKSGGEERK